MFRLAHLSDVHLAPLPPIPPAELFSKRVLGYINWLRKRKAIHLRSALDQLVTDLEQQSVDHIAITGDLVNISTPEEYLQAMNWLRSVGSPANVSIVPGNHDTYVSVRQDKGLGLWQDYYQSDKAGQSLRPADNISFPYIRVFNNVALVGLKSGIPTPPFMASGELGKEQLSELRRILTHLGQEQLFRVILIHHPPFTGQTSWSRALRDSTDLERVLQECGAELLLFGHLHQNSIDRLQTNSGEAVAVGVPSASRGIPGKEPLARYNIIEITSTSGDWKVDIVGRGFRSEGGEVGELERRQIY